MAFLLARCVAWFETASQEDVGRLIWYDPVPSHRLQYTIGLGQEYMAYTDDSLDINAMLLTGDLWTSYTIS